MNKQIVVAMTLSLVVILAIVTVIAEDSEAEDVDGYSYTLWTKTGTATLKGFSGEPVADVVIPETITVGDNTYTVNKIGSGAFKDQVEIKSVIIQSSDIELESRAFAGCTGLTSFTANSLTESTNSTFEGCTALKTFIINDDLTLRHGAFKNCTVLETFKVGGTDYSIDNNLIIDPNGTVIAYTCGDNANVVIPDSVTAIGKNVFWNSSISSVIFGANVESVGDNAFCQCHDLAVVELNDKLEVIGDYAFESTALTEIDLPESLTSLGGNAFRSCSSLETIDVPESVETVGAYTFSGCSALKTVTGMEGVTTIGQDAFSNSDIETITFSSKLTSIGQSAFAYCDSLESVDIPTTDGTLNIANRAFADCDNLNEFTAGGDVSFNNKVFENNSNLLTVNTPNVKSLGSNTFDGCTALTEVTLGADCDIPETAFKDCSKLNSVTIGDETFPVTSDGSVGTYAFQVGDNKYATLKEAVDSIQSKGSVTAIDDFTMFTDEIVTIPQEKEIKLDMNGMTATAASDFEGRYIINNGALTITGDGTFEDADSPKYKGPVTNNGTLTIENGTFHGNTTTESALIWNEDGATATFNGGTYEGAVTIINGYIGSKTYINDGSYTTSWYPVIDNSGYMVITGGEFVNTSCSSCDSKHWGYTIRSGVSNSEAYLLIKGDSDESVKVTGTQGALSITGGTADIFNGTYEIVDCEKKHGATFYACYIAGESFKNAATIYGGTFIGNNREALHIGNSNPAPDSGVGESSVVNVKGGTFKVKDTSTGVNPIKVDDEGNAEGAASITGGTFIGMTTDELKAFLPDGYEVDSNGQVGESDDAKFVAEIDGTRYTSISEAISNALDGETIDVIAGEVTLSSSPVLSGRSITISIPEGSALILDEGMKLEVSDGSLSLTGGGTVLCTVDGQITIDGGSLILGSITLDSEGVYTNADGTYTAGPTIIWLQSSSTADVPNYSVLNVSEDATIRYDGTQEDGAYAVAIDYVDGMNTAYGVVIDFDGTIVGNVDVAFYINGMVAGTEGNVPVITIGSDSNTTGTIYAAGYAKWYIHGGQFEGTTALSIKSGYFEIDGGTFHATGAFNDPADANGNGSEETGAAVSITTNDKYAGKVDINIAGGIFTSDNGYAVYEGIAVDENGAPAASESSASLDIQSGTFKGNASKGDVAITEAKDRNVISGGIFSSDVSEYCADGFTIAPNLDGTYGITESVTVTFDMPDGDDVLVEIPKGTAVPSSKIPTASPGYMYGWTTSGVEWDPNSVVNDNQTVVATMALSAPTASFEVEYDDNLGALITVKASHPASGVGITYSATSPTEASMEMNGSTLYTQLPGNHVIIVAATDPNGLTANATVTVPVSFENQTQEDSVVVDIMPDQDAETVTVNGLSLGFENLVHGNLGVAVSETESEDISGYGMPSTSYEIIVAGSAWTSGNEIQITVPISVPDGQRVVSGSVVVLYIPEEGSPVDMNAGVGSDGESIVFTTTHNSEYAVFYDLEAIPEDDPSFNPYPGDDDDYVPLPPTIVYEDDGSDSTASIAACAAAAVVAAILAIVLASTYRRK